MRKQLLLVGLACACSARSQLALDYTLVGLQPAEVFRLETSVSVDPSDPRNFFSNLPFTEVAPGIGYEVRDFDGSGQKKMLITHDVSLGFTFSNSFTFTLLPPSNEAPPPLVIVARASGMSDRIGSSTLLHGTFGNGRSLAVAVMDMRCNGVACPANNLCCNNACTDTSTDTQNCGACGSACGGSADTCTQGSCRCGSGSACSTGQTCCSGLGCVDLSTSAFNCGACGHACNPGETCQAGVCKCGSGDACSAGGLCCAGGTCSTTGACPCGTADCPAPNLCCDPVAGTCVDVHTNNQNCGGCGITCPAALSCQNGACTCQGQICGTADNCCDSGCANLMNDTANCGGCGRACALNETCSGGVCQCGASPCTTGQACCNNACVNPGTDPMNCGGCGILCHADEACVGGVCQCPGTNPARACNEPPEGCCAPSSSDGGGCFDLTFSHDHCGACGIACSAAQQCQNSVCVTTTCTPPCTNRNTCDSGTCRCNGSGGCVDPNTCCSSGCTDTRSDAMNCGSCGTKCGDIQLCCGSCVARDASHCQACDKPCPLPPNGSGNVFCCSSAGGWSCTPENVNNCGGCGRACSTGQVCCPPTNTGGTTGGPLPPSGSSGTGGGGTGTSTCRQESDFACGPACANCNAAGQVCCGHQCCNGICCKGQCCQGISVCALDGLCL
jgi:hypothetical protein